MHRDEVKAFRGSAEHHLRLLVGLGGPQALRDMLDPPVNADTVDVDPCQLDYYPFRDRSWWWSVAELLAARSRSLWDAFCCLLPAVILWVMIAPSMIEISPILAFAVGVAMILLAALLVWRAVRKKEIEP